MTLHKKMQVRLTEHQYIALQQMAIYLHTDVSSVIRSAVDDAIETLNRWTNLEIIVENDKEPADEENSEAKKT